jgi:signal transduction histidine kinase
MWSSSVVEPATGRTGRPEECSRRGARRVVRDHDPGVLPVQEDDIVRRKDDGASAEPYGALVRRRSLVFDALLALAALATGQAEAWTGALATHRQGPHWAEALAYGIPAVLLAFRRVRPLQVLLAMCAVMAVEFVAAGSPEGFGVAVPPVVAMYTVANLEDRRRSLWGLAAGLVLGVVWIAADPADTAWVQRLQGTLWLSPWVIAWLLGAYLRARRLYVEGLVREREEKALTAVAEERNRIARELHDVIGHSVSVMTVQASAVRRLMHDDQGKERAALETVEQTGREALTEMRRMVGVLRAGGGGPDLAPPPTLEQLDRLVAHTRQAGLDVVVRTEGEPVALPPGLDLTAYRLVQEALTNTLKHASATRADIRIDYRPDCLEVSVTDDGHGPDPAAEPGTGLLGMTERVAVYGGRLTTGAGPDGGFRLRAELPLEGA